MQVIKRDKSLQYVNKNKIYVRINRLKDEMSLDRISIDRIVTETIKGIYDKIPTEQLDIYASDICSQSNLEDPQYYMLAGGIYCSNLQKNTSNDFLEVTEQLYNNIDMNGDSSPLVCEEYLEYVKNNIDRINKMIDYKRDFCFDYFAIKTLERNYLTRTKFRLNIDYKEDDPDSKKVERFIKTIERPQHLWMRTAIGIHFKSNDLDMIFNTYELLSKQYFTHASPTLFNAGSKYPQLSSCFLLDMDDNMSSIMETKCDIAEISKWSGGIGVSLSNIRSKGSLIRKTNGISEGIIPLIRVLDALGRYVNQGGRRNGAIAVYLEPWHSDIFEFCNLRKNVGDEKLRARDIFLGLWIPDLFMKRVTERGMWSLMCPDKCKGLVDVYGDKFNDLYLEYEKKKMYVKQVKAMDLFQHIMDAQIETGMPYMLYKDACNKYSNQKNLGTIKLSNLCTEIIEFCRQDEVAVCNLASICLPKFVEFDSNNVPFFNYEKLVDVVKQVTINLNRIIDINYYPIEKARKSNMSHRPVAIGVQGLADVYYKMDLPFDSVDANMVNIRIFETIYYSSLKTSNELAIKYGPYSTFKGSPFSEGKLQFHLRGMTEEGLLTKNLFDWVKLRKDIVQHGTYNSLLTAVMPTASTAQIMGNTECIEPYTTNIYTRSTSSGQFRIVNKYLIEKLIKLGLWNEQVMNEFVYDNGSIQNIDEIPSNIKNIFKTALEMNTKPIIDQSISRSYFIDQSQSLNIFSNSPDYKKLMHIHIYGWKKGLKTGMYYCRSQPAVNPIKFGLDPSVIKDIEDKRKKEGKEIKNYITNENNARSNFKECASCT